MRVERAAAFVRALANRERHALGFLPDTIYAPALVDGRCELITAEGWEAGYILRGPWREETKIFQIGVVPGVRLEDCGRSLFLRMKAQAVIAGVEAISLHCAVDLAANEFWEKLGLRCIGTRAPRSATAREAKKWQWLLPRGEALEKELSTLVQDSKQQRLLELMGVATKYREHLVKRTRRRLFAGATIITRMEL
jgi:hypothetical protein